jgi:1,2-diacylglycerol 3-alpha-glucosyltransferase
LPNGAQEMTLRILMISDVYFPRINGVSTSIQTFRRSLHAAGHETVLIAPEYPGRNWIDSEPGILRVPSRYVPRDPEDRMMIPSAIKALKPQLKPKPFDLVHIQTPFVAHYLGLHLARWLGVPAIETYHTYFEEYLHHYVPLLPRSLMRFAARRFTVSQCNDLAALVVPSQAMETALKDYGVECPMHIIPTGLELGRFAQGNGQQFRQKLGISPGQPTLVHVGRIAHEKNIDFLFRMLEQVLKSIPDAVMIVAGEGPALKHCRDYVESRGLISHVRFVGYLSRDAELLDCYQAGDLFVFSSRTETQGLVLLEAMALGTPVVSTAYMGTLDILRPERGARIAPDDEAGFAAIVTQLLRDPGLRSTLSAEARAYAMTWSAPVLAERMAQLYAEVAGKAQLKAAA